MSEERWLPVAGFHGRYSVSDHGRVMNVRRQRLLRPGRQPRGHLRVWLYKNNVGRPLWVHRLVLEAFVGPRPPGQECRHLDGDPANNHVSNLTWGTSAENKADRLVHGTSNRGSRHGMAKLREVQVVEIKRRLGLGEVAKCLAKEFGVTPAAVNLISRGKSWGWLVATEPSP